MEISGCPHLLMIQVGFSYIYVSVLQLRVRETIALASVYLYSYLLYIYYVSCMLNTFFCSWAPYFVHGRLGAVRHCLAHILFGLLLYSCITLCEYYKRFQ